MSVFKRYNGKRITSKDPHYKAAKWWMYKRVAGHKTIHKSLPEAQTKEQALTAERKEIERIFNRRYGITDDSTTFQTFVESVYEKYVAQNNVNLKAKEIYIRNLKAFFGKMPLIDITAQDCRDYQHKCKNTKTRFGGRRAASSVNLELSTLSKIFSLACEQGKLERNPMQYVKYLKEPPPRKRLLSPEEKANLWREIEKDTFLYRIVTLAVNLPLRKGQILAITKEAIDFDKRILLAIGSKGREPRLVPLNDSAFRILKELADETRSGVLIRLDGKPVKDFGKRWRHCLVRAGINKENDSRENNFHFHDLRREFASELIRRNINPKLIQKLFAHSDMSITNIYTSVDEQSLFDAVKALDESVQESKGIN